MGDLESDTDYLVCVTTNYGTNGKKDRCQRVVTHCNRDVWAPVAIISGCATIVFLCAAVFLTACFKQRRRKQKLKQNNDLVQCRACEQDERWTDEYDLIEPLNHPEHGHEYFEIKDLSVTQNQDKG